MTTDLLELSDSIITGRTSIESRHPVAMMGVTELHEMADGMAFIESFANVIVFDVEDRLAMIDAGGILAAGKVHRAIREWSDSPLDTAVYTHGHVDHVFAVPMFEAEDAPIRPTVVSHANVPARFDRYQLTNGYNGWINARQFQLPEPMFPKDFRYPDHTYETDLDLTIGGLRIELHHDKGETDDGTWAFIPERSVLCTGDLFIWAAPNCGNPQKVQRFPVEWAAALRKMAAVGAELMLPGHGLPIAGRDRIAHVLTSAAELLESLVEQTLEMMNAGATLDDLIHTVTPPAHLMELPWLQPVYDEPEFIVRNLWRLYGGWYDGDPSTLKPAPKAALAAELTELAGGATVLADRAEVLSAAGEHRLACHLVELAAQSSPDDPAIHRVRARVYAERSRHERSVMSKGVFTWARRQSEQVVED